MDEQNVLASEDVCETLCPNLESSIISAEISAKPEESASGLLLSADHIQIAHLLPADNKQRSADQVFLSVPGSRASVSEPSAHISAENQRFAGGSEKETLGDARSRMQAGTLLDVDVDCTSSSQYIAGVHESAAPQEVSDPANEYGKDIAEMPGNPEIKREAVLLTNRQVHTFASADSSMMPGTRDDAVHRNTDEEMDVVSKGIPMHLDDGIQQAGDTDLVRNPVESMIDEGCEGEASLEMLSVAVESFENMQRESEGGLSGAREAVERTVAGKKLLVHDIEHDAVEAKHNSVVANCGILESSVKKSMGDSEDSQSFIFKNSKALGGEFRNKDHFLNLLCELAAVQQQEQELSMKGSNLVTSCAASFVENEAGGELKRLSFVDLLRKQMAQAGTFSESTVAAIYEQFLRQNQAILGTTLVENFNLSLPSAGISSNDGGTTALEVEQISNGNSDREGDTPSNEEIVDDFRNGEAQDEVGGHSTRDDDKNEIRGEEKKFGVGDLVWAKVKSHPWWPGQIFNAADASAAAKKIQRPGRILVAFFGDGTFGWLQQSQLIAFRPNFGEKVQQTTMKSFCKAVAEALNEVSRRTELGLRCSHSSDAMYSKNVFPDLNAGMRKGVRIKRHQDIRISRERLEPNRVLEFIQTAARSPLFSLSSGLEYSELCGHVYGFRNFMLSPKKPKSKLVAQKVQNKLKSAQSSSSKRRWGLDEIGDSSSMGLGKEVKRLHLSKDTTMKEQHTGKRDQSPKFRTIENLLFTESNEKMVLETEVKSPEPAQKGTWLAKGKRLQVSPDCKEGKRVKGWRSLGPLGDLADSGGADNLTSTDDDSKTLLDITGYHSLRKRKKKGGTSRSVTDMVAKKVEHQPLEAREELLSSKSLSKGEEIGEESGNVPYSSTSSLSTVVPDNNLSILSMTKECGIAEDCDKIKEELPDSIIDDAEEMEKGSRELLDSEDSDADKMEEDKGGVQESKIGDRQDSVDGKGELQTFRDTDAEAHETVKEEMPDLKLGDAKEIDKDEGILDVKEWEALNDHDNVLKKQTKHSYSQEHEKDNGELPDMKVGDSEGGEKDKGKLEESSVSVLQDGKKESDNTLKRKKQQTKCLHSHSRKHEKDKGELQDLKVDDAEENEKEKGKILDLKDSESLPQDVNEHENVLSKKKKQTMGLHSQEDDLLSLLVKPKKRKQDAVKQGGKQSSSSPKKEHFGSKKSDKSSKLGASIKKVADSLKGTPGSSKLAYNSSAQRAVSAASIEFEVKKHLKSPRSNQSLAFKNSADENLNNSFAILLNNLQAVARDPLSSANMKSSLHGVMSTFLKFRSMVFLKSSGYGTAGVGKLKSSCGNGHVPGDKKVDDKGGSGNQTFFLERQKSFVTDSSEERKSIVKAELPSESVGPGSQRPAVQDSSSKLKAAAMKRPHSPSTALASQKSNAAKMSSDTETASAEMPMCPKNMIGGSQKLGVQELAVAARKKKSEVLKESAAKVQVENEVLKGQNFFREKVDKEKFTDARHHAKSVKHHISRAETLSVPERKNSMYNSLGVKVAQTSLGLFMQFPEDFALPSEAQLKELFNPFGILEVAGIRVYKNASTAQVVFKHSTDAEAAWQHARKNRMFGHANVSYRLRHFSLSTKSNFKHYEVALAKNGLAPEAIDLKSPLVENHGRSSLSSGAEQGSSIEAVHSPARISSISRVEPTDSRMSAVSPVRSTSLSKAEPVLSPVRSTSLSRGEPGSMIVLEPEPSPVPILSHIRAEPVASTVPAPEGNFSSSAEQGGFMLPEYDSTFRQQEANLSTHLPLPSNLPKAPSVSNVNAPCGDIQDEMLKLLQQVSVIVSSSTFISRTA